ncbi:hypothetical protein SAMN06297129_2515 [Pseudooceanicola antarcticus]|uniref:Lipoprotein n=1 Tax=Pseudooceanicola antarcticus TaxID=1247613 RepID=A0A285IYX1_9RHOB|nr:hypothetical protein [Pseudooceanicola antarcticus]PJE25704.1 hypothetical protein CVM39_18515 [Pseudooceanicola antarcticus]SNY53182.1 hypothetical protein SAMN06297129_2515 [Pseudooceanicola antarcticus]
MRKFLPVLLIAALGVSGCGYVRDSRLNPFNWFGSAESRELSAAEAAAQDNPLIPKRSAFANKPDADLRDRIAGLEGLVVERIPGGAIVRVTGISSSVRSFDVGLRELPGTPGVARYEMVTYLPEFPATGPVQTRRYTAAVRLSDTELAQVRTIEVLSASNALTSRR